MVGSAQTYMLSSSLRPYTSVPGPNIAVVHCIATILGPGTTVYGLKLVVVTILSQFEYYNKTRSSALTIH